MRYNSIRSASRRTAWPIQALLACIALTLATPAIASAHAVVYPKVSTPGAYERYVLRVPNEKTVATTRVEIHFPDGLRITGFEDIPGWRLEILTDSAERIIGAVWTGTLAPQRFVEFPFMAANPKTATELTWQVYQTYQGLPRVEWTGPKGSRTPASITSIVPADTAATVAPTASRPWLPWLALVVAVISLGVALRPKESAQ